MVKWYIGSRRLASMVHARSYISFNACNTLCMCTQKKRCTFTSNEKQLYWKKVEWIRYWMDEIQTQRAMASTAVMCWKWRKPSDWNSANWTWRKKSVSAKQSHYKSLSILIERTSFLFVAHFAPALDCLWMFTRAHAHTQAQLFFVLLRNRLLQICEREKKSEHTHTRTHTNTQIEKSPCMSIERRTRAFTSNYRIFLPLCSILMTGQTQNRVNVLRNVSQTNHQTIISRDCAILCDFRTTCMKISVAWNAFLQRDSLEDFPNENITVTHAPCARMYANGEIFWIKLSSAHLNEPQLSLTC